MARSGKPACRVPGKRLAAIILVAPSLDRVVRVQPRLAGLQGHSARAPATAGESFFALTPARDALLHVSHQGNVKQKVAPVPA